jgi:hypothetical protein
MDDVFERFLPWEPEWERLVGRFVLCFGDIERVVTECLRQLPADPIGETASKLFLKSRLELLDELLSPESTPERVELRRRVRDVERYIDKRNIVAHNGLTLDIYREADGVVVSGALESGRARGKRIDYAQMQQLAEEVGKLAAELAMAWINVRSAEGLSGKGPIRNHSGD